MTARRRVSRRQLLGTLGILGAASLVAACGGGAPVVSPTSAPASGGAAPAAAPTATAAPQPAAAAAPTPAASSATPAAPPAGPATKQLPRNQTVIMSLSDAVNQFTDVQLMNPFIPSTARNGWQFAYEPLAFYNMWWNDQTCAPQGMSCKDGEVLWLAESYTYSQDYSELLIKLRSGVTWSDGQPFTADDVAFTLTMLRDNAPKLNYSTEMKTWVKDAIAVDPQNAKVTLTGPNPRFFANYLTFFSDIGFPIIPQHIFKGKDPTSFTNLDLNQGWPVVTGPWKLSFVNSEQRFWDLREDWWAAKTGFHSLPKPQRVITLPNYSDDKYLELLTANEVDTIHGFQNPYTVPTALQRNPKLIGWTIDNKPPYGALDVATATRLAFNCSKPPFDDKDIRWAINYAIDRDQIIAIGSHGIGAKTNYIFPPVGALKQYDDAISDILQKNPIDVHDPNKTAQILQSKGYAKDNGGFWAKDGKRFAIVITATPPFFTDISPVIVEQLRKAGFDASWKSPSNAGTLISQGDVDAYFDIPGGSVRDPYLTLSFFQSKVSAPTGQPAVRPYRWKNDQFDQLVDQLGKMSPSDSGFMSTYHQAMEQWVPELPEIPLILRYIYITPNTTYWTNWPSEKYSYTLASPWHRHAGLFLNTIQPAQG
jgi:peptide/nickel transport system substrate-binding protein